MRAIYIIKNLVNGKNYIGQTNNLKVRWNKHKNDLNKNKHINRHLQNAWDKYGENNFKFEIIKECNNTDNLNELEKHYIKKYNSNNINFGYNLTSGGEGYELNDSVKKQISINKRGQGSNLTEGDVTKIKMLLYCLMDRDEISKIFNISKKVITQIATGKSFGYVCSELNEDIHNLKQKLIDERNEYIISLFDKGYTITQISKITEYSKSIVEKCVYKYRNTVKENKEKYQDIYNKVFELNSKGFNNSQISKKLNISGSTVKRYLTGENNPYKELPYKKITEDIKNDIIKLYFNENNTFSKIAEKYNVSTNTISTVINNYKYANTEVI